MKTKSESGYSLMELLIYIGVVGALLAVGYAAVDRCIDRSAALYRNANDITSALHIGEVWRADVRSATVPIAVEANASRQTAHLTTPRGEILYRFETNALSRRVSTNHWVCLLPRVKASSMAEDRRKNATAWKWELELLPDKNSLSNTNHIVPLFTFLAAPQQTTIK
jgi:Tfp pilus assembly protein FimT